MITDFSDFILCLATAIALISNVVMALSCRRRISEAEEASDEIYRIGKQRGRTETLLEVHPMLGAIDGLTDDLPPQNHYQPYEKAKTETSSAI